MQKKEDVLMIDWYGTLSNSRFWDNCEIDIDTRTQAERILFHSPESPEIFGRWMRGQMDTDSVMDWVSQQGNLDKGYITRNLYESARNMKFIFPELPAYMDELQRQGTRVFIATDNMDTFWYTMEGMRLRTIFEGVLNSSNLLALKADRHEDGSSKFWGGFLRANNIGPQNVTLIDDSASARVHEFGMNFIQVTPEDQLKNILETRFLI